MKTYISVLILLIASLLGFINHQYPDDWKQVADKIFPSQPDPIQAQLPQATSSIPDTKAFPAVIQKPQKSDTVIVAQAPSPVTKPAIEAWMPPASGTTYPKEWVCKDQTFEDVSVQKVDPDCVTIMHRDGVALIPISSLPLDLQKLLNFNPEAADVAAKKRAQEEQLADNAFTQNQQQLADAQQAQALADNQARAQMDAANRADRIANLQKRIAQLQDQANQEDSGESDRIKKMAPGSIYAHYDASGQTRRQIADLQAELSRLQ